MEWILRGAASADAAKVAVSLYQRIAALQEAIRHAKSGGGSKKGKGEHQKSH
jgi:hypothetical protein